MTFIEFFTDPILRAPTIGSMLMCLAASLVGVLVFVRKRSLLGEALAHATYPGVTLAIVFAGVFSLEKHLPFLIIFGAFLSSLLGFWVIDRLEKKFHVSSDAALCAVLALFFGGGVTISSYAQHAYPSLHREMLSYLYGQAATMTDVHIAIYAILVFLVIVFILLFYKEVLALSFDRQFAYTVGIKEKYLNTLAFLVIVLTLVIGIRCVGVVLMSAMLIAPAAAARQFTHRLSYMFVLSGFFGLISGFLGIYASVTLSAKVTGHYTLPTGPTIVLVAGFLAFYALFFAPKRGLLIRYFRVVKFRHVCIQENLLKTLWRLSQGERKKMTFKQIAERESFSSIYLRFRLFLLICQQTVEKREKQYCLTSFGAKKGARIVRLHRLWEAYLVNSLGLNVERVHKSAEEMEHILTPELEKRVAELLDDPKQDPHDQPIPPPNEEIYVS